MENIALAFSGGGFRAAAYSLGCLEYLNKVQYKGKPLLQYVKFISSTSGGSITALVYGAYVYEGKNLQDVSQKLNAMFDGEKLLAKALANLDDNKAWIDREHKSKNLINAFSLVYDDFFEKRTLGMFSNLDKNPHLEELCINSTEFTNGYAFRFQSQNDGLPWENGRIGNHYIQFSDADGKNGIAIAKKLKLGDILASSSCFPSGFEPLIFPQDYETKELSSEDLIKGLSFETNNFSLDSNDYNNTDFLKDKSFDKKIQFGIMDGGVADNQAIEAFMLADDRRKKNDPNSAFSLFISCDVTSYFMDGYTLPVAENKWYSNISFNTARALIMFIVLSVSAWVPFSIFKFRHNWQLWNSVSVAVASCFFIPVVVWFASKIFKRKPTASDGTWALVFKKYMHVFKNMKIGRLKDLLVTRAKSVFILANDIYLKQIRRIYYNRLYSDPDYKGRVIQNAIYDLSEAKFNLADPLKKESYDPPEPSAAVKTVVEKARTMGTTLWFDPNHQKQNIKECIVATGRFTTCYNLLKFIRKTGANTAELKQLEAELMNDYAKFQVNPMWNLS
ncbi:MAG: patatin-like phospholipase family protein [Bacteroidetes bacterium]|nr:patatin-like phospholipase family protein [Bacteroidota bacterium]